MHRPSPKDLLVLMIDSKFFGGDCVVAAIGIDVQGRKHVLGIWHGATENSTVVKGSWRIWSRAAWRANARCSLYSMVPKPCAKRSRWYWGAGPGAALSDS